MRTRGRGRATGCAEGPDTSARLLRAAARLFAHRGYAATSVREILRAADVTAPVLYYHFGSKQRLFLGTVQAAIQEFRRNIRSALRWDGHSAERLVRVCEALQRMADKHRDTFRMVEAVVMSPTTQGALLPEMRAEKRWFEDAIGGVIAGGVAAGELRGGRADDMATAVIGAASKVVREGLFDSSRRDGTSRLRRVLRAVLEGLVVDRDRAWQRSKLCRSANPGGAHPDGRSKGRGR